MPPESEYLGVAGSEGVLFIGIGTGHEDEVLNALLDASQDCAYVGIETVADVSDSGIIYVGSGEQIVKAAAEVDDLLPTHICALDRFF